MPENQKELEIKPRGKVLFVNMSPGSLKPSIQIANGVFGAGKSVEDFPEMVIRGINSPPLIKEIGEESGSLRQTKESFITLPDINSISGLVITGSPFSAPLLTRDRQKLGAEGEGKGVYLPFWQNDLFRFINKAYDAGVPTLGICYGCEAIVEARGGRVKQFPKTAEGNSRIEVGYSFVYRVNDKPDPILADIPQSFVAITNRTREIIKLPEGAEELARSRFGIQALRIGNMWGLQFHPEKTASDAAKLINDNRKKVIINEQMYLGNFYDRSIGKQILTNFGRIVARNTRSL